VASPRLFRLKAEVAPAPSGPIADTLPIARVRVDTGVFHLDQLYDYAIPQKISAGIKTGVRVQIPFGGRETEGIVVSRSATPERAGELKSITKVLSLHPVATKESLELVDHAAAYYCCNPWDLIRSAIPPRVANVDKELTENYFEMKKTSNKGGFSFQSFAPFSPAHRQLPSIIKQVKNSGSILIVAPDEKDVAQICITLSNTHSNVIPLTSSSAREERYRNFLLSMRLENSIVVGTRSAVFAPVNNLAAIIIFKESSPEHYEVRSPGWNTCAIAKMRTELQGVELVFTGFAPSINTAFDIDRGLTKYRNQRVEVKVEAFTPNDGTLLPGRIFSEIKRSLKSGPVLFLAPRKGYGNALLCAHCKNIALCKCGGRLSVASKNQAPTCVHCGTGFPQWRCSFCQRDKQYLGGRGIDRAAEEISRAFPGFPVIISAADVIKERVESKPSLVLSTPGAQPLVDGGYAAVVVLDATRFFSHTDINSQERARELIFETSSLISQSGKVLLVIEDSHPIVPAVARWNIAPMLKRELAERADLNLPPTVTSAVLVLDANSAPSIAAGLNKAKTEGRLPLSSRIFGPTQLPKSQAKIVIHVASEQWSQLAHVLHELQRKRSISKKDLLTLRIDPYSL
jgi:primosomal protein N' (replication factor Y)